MCTRGISKDCRQQKDFESQHFCTVHTKSVHLLAEDNDPTCALYGKYDIANCEIVQIKGEKMKWTVGKNNREKQRWPR